VARGLIGLESVLELICHTSPGAPSPAETPAQPVQRSPR
jgi:hypothetical protein